MLEYRYILYLKRFLSMKILIQILKITILSLLFAVAIHFTYGALNEGELTTKPSEMTEVQNFSDTWNNNKYKFKNSDTQILANVWVALTTNVWTKFKQRWVNNLYTWVASVSQVVASREYSDATNAGKHMQNISEYYNIMKTDVSWMLQSSNHKRETLDAYIDQLWYRYKMATANKQELQKKKTELQTQLTASVEKINKIKARINVDFKAFDADNTNRNIDWYLRAKWEYNYARTHLIFINQYIKQYEYLNNYNKTVMDALINNKDVISKNSYVVIPDTGTEVLKKMNLIISESDFKAE